MKLQSSPSVPDMKTRRCPLARDVLGLVDSMPRKTWHARYCDMSSLLWHVCLECPRGGAPSVPASDPSVWSVNSAQPQEPVAAVPGFSQLQLEWVECWFLSPVNNGRFSGMKGNLRGETADWEHDVFMSWHAGPCLPCCPRPPAQGTGASEVTLNTRHSSQAWRCLQLPPLRKTVGLAHASNTRCYCVTLDESPNLSDH